MSKILYYLSLPFLYLLSVLPFPVLYAISDGFYVIIYHVLGYRKKVVLKNLRNSFPEKSDKEIDVICRKFYRYFCDLFLETFKTLTISKNTMLKHCAMDADALALFDRLAKEGKSVIIVMGHKGNWEWGGNTFSLCCKHQLYVIYHPLANKHFNDLICGMRMRFGTKLIPMKETFRDMVKHKNDLTATAFIADQSPAPETAFWMNFLNQDTPVFMGTEKIAGKMKYPIVYVTVKRVTRGYYTMMADLLTEPPYAASEGEITTAHTQRLEADIVGQPETWLWTHRRWKHSRAQGA